MKNFSVKKVLALLLAMAMIFSMASTGVFAHDVVGEPVASAEELEAALAAQEQG